jgi:hypothetical protein
MPTPAHAAIARLVRDGALKVLVTTNFDRLLERALEEAGVVPIVLATSDALEGAIPLAHTQCTIVKVHGDYLDARIRNTPTELAHYDSRIDGLLDQIFDEYGLIVCGWSGECGHCPPGCHCTLSDSPLYDVLGYAQPTLRDRSGTDRAAPRGFHRDRKRRQFLHRPRGEGAFASRAIEATPYVRCVGGGNAQAIPRGRPPPNQASPTS